MVSTFRRLIDALITALAVVFGLMPEPNVVLIRHDDLIGR
jgi:hypothetical protein